MRVFKRKRNGEEEPVYTIRFQFDGKERQIRTEFRDKHKAEALGRSILAELKAQRIGNVLSDLKARREQTVGSILRAYAEAGCPNAAMEAKIGQALEEERTRIETAAKWFNGKDPAAITPADHDDYWVWRRGTVTRGTGDRTTELELQSVSNAFHWAIRKRLVAVNPFEKRRGYRSAADISHAKEFMPADGDELHQVARSLLADPRSQALGFAYLLGALAGLRFWEIRHLRDAAPAGAGDYPAGHFDDQWLYIARAKHGKNPRVRLDDATRPHLRHLLEIIRAWKLENYPHSSWLLPGRGGAQLSADALTHTLARATKKLGLPKRTGHGARAYYATVRWAQGIDPDQIAHELGQRSGDELVREVYGGSPPQWDGALNRKSWLPNSQDQAPAWAPFEGPANITTIPQQQKSA